MIYLKIGGGSHYGPGYPDACLYSPCVVKVLSIKHHLLKGESLKMSRFVFTLLCCTNSKGGYQLRAVTTVDSCGHQTLTVVIMIDIMHRGETPRCYQAVCLQDM